MFSALFLLLVSLNYRRDAGKVELDAQAQREKQRIESLAQGERLSDWAKRNQYSLIGGSWAVSMGIATGIVMRARYASYSTWHSYR